MRNGNTTASKSVRTRDNAPTTAHQGDSGMATAPMRRLKAPLIAAAMAAVFAIAPAQAQSSLSDADKAALEETSRNYIL